MSTPRFLIVRLGSLGDVVHAIPAAAALRRQYPSARIDWMVDPRYVELLELVEGLDQVIAVQPRAIGRTGGADVFRAIGRARRVRYDAVIDLQGLLKSAVLARAAGGIRTIGFPKAHLREPMARLFYSETPDPGTARHVVFKNIGLLGAVGVRDLEARCPLRVPRTDVTDVVARQNQGRAYALVNPGAAWMNKRWPAVRFGALAAMMHRDLDLRSVILWGRGEEGLASEVARASSGAAEVAPPTTIQDLVGLAHGARLLVSGDTGPMHIAAAVGTPVVAMFGPTFPERNGPWSAEDVTVSRVEQCVCHYQRQCRRSDRCIDQIGLEEVAAAVRRRLGGSH